MSFLYRSFAAAFAVFVAAAAPALGQEIASSNGTAAVVQPIFPQGAPPQGMVQRYDAVPGAATQTDGETLPVLAVTVYPGDTITEAMVIDRQFPVGVSQRYAALSVRDQVIGKVARRTLAAGQPIPLNALGMATLVNRGVPTEASYVEDGLSITAQVMPMQSGGVGDVIQVRNVDSGRMISGVVQADGTVRVGGR